MLKKLLFLLISMQIYGAEEISQKGMSKRTKVVIGGVIVIGGVVAAPFILPAATLTAIQATAVTVAANISAAGITASTTVSAAVTSVAGPTVGGFAGSVTASVISVPSAISAGVVSAKIARPYVFETEEEEVAQLKSREVTDSLQAKTNFRNCLIKNKHDRKQGSFGCSAHCQDTAYRYGLLAGLDEVEKVIKSV